MAVHTFWNTLNACKYRYTCDCRADSSQHRVCCNWNNYQSSHSIYLVKLTNKQTTQQRNKHESCFVIAAPFDTDRQVMTIQFWELSRSPPDLPQCGSIDIDYPPFSRFLIWLSIGGWLASTNGGGHVCSLSSPRGPCEWRWALVFWFSCWAVVWFGWPSRTRDRRLFGVLSLYHADVRRCC